MDYKTVLELVDEMPLKDKRRLAKHLNATLVESSRPENGQSQAHRDRVRQALAGMLTEYEIAPDDPARSLNDAAAERLLDELHRETQGAEPLSTAVIEDRMYDLDDDTLLAIVNEGTHGDTDLSGAILEERADGP